MRKLSMWILWVAVAGVVNANEIGFVESFSLADDRAVALQQLVPGTDDYYFYHALHYQATGQRKQYDEMMANWIKRRDTITPVKELMTRQALLDFSNDPKASTEYFRRELGLQFNHSRPVQDSRDRAPTRLDVKLIEPERLRQDAFRRSSNLQGLEDAGVQRLEGKDLDPTRRRDLLNRLDRPDFTDLVSLILADLDAPDSGRFGSLRVHNFLLLEQFEALARLRPALLREEAFVNAWMARLLPGDDVDMEVDAAAREAYLDRLLTFTRSLEPLWNSVKAHALYNRLQHDRALGHYDQALFLEYLQIPRRVSYISQDYLRGQTSAGGEANLSADYRAFTHLPPIGSDEPLVRDYLLHFLSLADDSVIFAKVIDEGYLRRMFAEAKITSGQGDPERWASLLGPADFQRLKERVDVEFSPVNPRFFAPEEPVTLKASVKNVETLLVKVFEINAFNYYRDTGKPLDLAIELDGMVATREERVDCKASPFLRVEHSFPLPTLSPRGVYVVELIGNGVSSRALVQKGRLEMMERTTPAGHVLAVLDESGKRLQEAAAWMAGQEYKTDDQGRILIPFSTQPGRQNIILRHGDFAVLQPFEHQAETIDFAPGFYVDRESLRGGEDARLLIRPRLEIGGQPADVALLKDVRLIIDSVDRDGVSARREVPGLELHNDSETVFAFAVPQRLSSISFTLTARIRNVSLAETQDVSGTGSFSLNGVERLDQVENMFLAREPEGYVLEVLGKNGEPRVYRSLTIRLKHREFREPVHVSLQTDEEGRCVLGELPGITEIYAGKPDGAERTWYLQSDFISTRGLLQTVAGQPLRIPLALTADRARALSLLETVGGNFTRDFTKSVTVKGRFAEIQGLPAGDYSLYIRPENRTVLLRVAAGDVQQGYAFSSARALELTPPASLQIESMTFDGKGEFTVQLAHATSDTRVHVVASRYTPAFSLFDQLLWQRSLLPAQIPVGPPESLYVSGRNIGDEYRYILDRRYATRFPGNMLERPSLLLNPWSRGETDSGQEKLAADEALRSREARKQSYGGRMAASMMDADHKGAGSQHDPSMEFLGQSAVTFLNLVPDADGRIVIPAGQLGHARQLRVLAVNRDGAVQREAVREGSALARRDIRFPGGLDPDKFYAEQKLIVPLQKNGKLTLKDGDVTRFEAYDTLGKVYGLYAALSGDATLADFAFIVSWPTLPESEQQRLYAKYACHELNLFLYHHDPVFFRDVIRPYLVSKRDKTFIDEWLLESPLERYLEPWLFERLNTAEQALLARRIAQKHDTIARRLRERWELIVPDADRFNHLFNTAVRRGALEQGAGPESGVAEAEGVAMDAVGEMVASPAVMNGAVGRALRMDKSSIAPALSAAPQRAEKAKDEMKEEAAREMEVAYDAPADAFGGFADLQSYASAQRGDVKALYRKLGATEEWAENNYYKRRPAEQLADLVPVNGFWRDYAEHEGAEPFVSANLAEPASNFTGMMMALAVLDLPFVEPTHNVERGDDGLQITAGGPAVIFYEEVRESQVPDAPSPLLIAQNFFRKDDRYRFEGNERYDKVVTDEFLPHVVYGGQVVLTNPGSSRRKLDLLLQIPSGAIPVENGFYSRGLPFVLEPFSTRSVEYGFYFPETGVFSLYPAQASFGGVRLAGAQPAGFKVVKTLSKVDTESWEYIAMEGSDAAVLAYIDRNNLARIPLDRVAFRYRIKAFYEALIGRLRARQLYDDTLWSYGIYHGDVKAIADYLAHSPLADRAGLYLESPLLTINPVERFTYEHLEYAPLVNPRAHRVGAQYTILNNRFSAQYEHFLKVLSYKPALNDEDCLAVAYYLLLQDRIEAGMHWFDRVDRKNVAEQVQYDYLSACVSLYRSDTAGARSVGESYRDYPVPRWRSRFVNLLNQLDEVKGGTVAVADADSREQLQGAHAASEPSLDLKVDGGVVELRHANVAGCQMNLYPMDIELLFSRNPFVQQQSARFAHIRPGYFQDVALVATSGVTRVELPEAYRKQNLMVEVTSGPLSRSTTYYANALTVQMQENYGQVCVSHAVSGKPLPGTYVKVYARTRNGQVNFYKDGYTDLRGRFVYASVSPTDLDIVTRFAVLVFSDEHGAVIREASPPAR